MRVLLIEDDASLGEAVRDHIAAEAHAVDWVRRLDDAAAVLAGVDFDLILLDLGLPDGRGLDFLRRLRQRGSTTPVIIVTAMDQISWRIEGLNAGADDYLVKPFDLDELAARARALLRRRTGKKQPVYTHGDLALDPAAHEVTLAGAAVALVPREFALLHILIEEPARVFTKAELEDRLYGWGEEVGSNTIEVHVHSLRRKLGAEQIVTVRGVGYRLKRCE